jgi:glucose/arabinose dehydrogenase
MSFDPPTGDLWIGDVGQGAREEIDYEPPGSGGRNYGWKRFEGTTLFDAGTAAPNAVGPIHEYSHADGCSVTGGVVYRGTAIPGLRGTYLFADYCSGRIWGLRQSNGRATEVGQLRASASEIVAFGVDDRGEVYLASLGGTVFQLVPG